METMKRPNYVEELLEIFRSPLNKEELLDKISDYHENDIAEAFEHQRKSERNCTRFLAQSGWLRFSLILKSRMSI